MNLRLPSPWIFLPLALFTSCAVDSHEGSSQRDSLLGTWAPTEGPVSEVTYHADGTWTSWIRAKGEDNVDRTYRMRGKWAVQDGAIHNTTLESDLVLPGLELPYLSIEKVVSVNALEYRYVCPVQDCTNTMRRVASKSSK